MKKLFSIGFLLTIICMPELALNAYLVAIGDLPPERAFGAIIAIPGNFVLSILT